MNKSTISIKLVALFLLLIAFGACEDDDNGIVDRNWQLVWQDEFEGVEGSQPDPTKWTYDIGTGPNNDGWGNQEFQYYTDRPSNVSLNGDGQLAITARNESFSGAAFTSGRIKTKGLFSQAYGRFEARIQIPYGPGIWPAFWMLGADIDENPWPGAGEIDVLEAIGSEPNFVFGSIHGPGYSAGEAITAKYSIPNSRFDTDFYLYAIEWTENQIDFYVDDVLYNRLTPEDIEGDEWVFDKPFFMLLNVACGGTLAGFPTSKTPFPQTMLVDYVRVYNQGN